MSRAASKRTITACLSEEMMAELTAYMIETRTTVSQAVRMLLQVALHGEAACASASVREGMQKGWTLMNRRLAETFTKTMSEIERGP